jgi:hypothetical protein
VPKDYGCGTGTFNDLARDIQQLAHACQIQPNYAANGVSLRGPWLYDGTQLRDDVRPELPKPDRNGRSTSQFKPPSTCPGFA